MTSPFFRYGVSRSACGGREIEQPGLRVNEAIEADPVRLIDHDGARLGITSLREARARAEEKRLDLVEVGPDSRPPVVRLMEVGWSALREQGRAREDREEASRLPEKVMYLRPEMAGHEYEFKVRHVRRFIEDGYGVTLTIRPDGRRGRDQASMEMLKKVGNDLGDVATVRSGPDSDDHTATITLEPLEES